MMLIQQFLSGFGLQGCKAKDSFPVLFQNKIDSTVTEITNPIKKYHRVIHPAKDNFHEGIKRKPRESEAPFIQCTINYLFFGLLLKYSNLLALYSAISGIASTLYSPLSSFFFVASNAFSVSCISESV